MAHLSESLEMYIKSIYLLAQRGSAVHAKDIAQYNNVSRPSVTGALKQLGEKNYVIYSPYEAVTLTTKGQKTAKSLIKRYDVLYEFFTEVLKIEPQEAERVACQMEHIIPEKILLRLIGFLDYMMSCPRGNVFWDGESKRFFCSSRPKADSILCKRVDD